MNEKIKHQMPGESGLIALDWHNGNRSVLSDSNLTGCIFGLTLQTKHEDIYRAYLEATAFGTKMIMQQYQDWHMEVEKYLHVAVYLKECCYDGYLCECTE